MRNFYQYILLGFVALLSLVACEKSDMEWAVDSSLSAEAETHEVRLVLTDGATRAHFEANEGDTRASATEDGRFLWQSGDRFRLYAHKSDGSNAFPADPYIEFSYWVNTTSAGRSFFRGSIKGDMNDGSYTYYAVYPHSTPVEGTTATFTLLATQDGTYSRYDFMVARSTATNSAAASGNALQAIRDNDRNTPEPMNDIALSFRHKLHALRFEIPSQGVLSSGIRRVHILFSEVVAGDIVVNMATDEVSYTNMTNKITVDFGAGNEKHSGDAFWVMTLPQESFSRAVDIRFEDSSGNFTTRQLVAFPSSQQYTAGRITPIKINVPTQYVGYTYLDATTVDTNLGEPVTHLHLDLPVGYYFPDYNTKNTAPDINGVHTFKIFNDIIDATFRAAPVTLTYESEHALIPTSTNFGDGLQVGKTNNRSWTTPWLFYEDFNNVITNDDESTKTEGAMMDKGGLVGWSGSRWKTDQEKKILMLSCYIGTTWGDTDVQYGRADTPPLTNIKPGKQPKIKVVYDLGLEKHRYTVWVVVANVTFDIQSQLHYGTTEYDAGNPITTGGSLAILGNLGKGQGYPQNDLGVLNSSNNLMTCDYSKVLDGDNGGTGYNASKMNTVNYTTVATNTTRLTWFENFYHIAGEPASRTLYLYLDNVRVSIAQ